MLVHISAYSDNIDLPILGLVVHMPPWIRLCSGTVCYSDCSLRGTHLEVVLMVGKFFDLSLANDFRIRHGFFLKNTRIVWSFGLAEVPPVSQSTRPAVSFLYSCT